MRDFERTRETTRGRAEEKPKNNRIEFAAEPNPETLEEILKKEDPTHPVPTSRRFFSISRTKNLKDYYGDTIKVLVDPVDAATIYIKTDEKSIKYTLLKKLKPPIADLYYGIKIDHEVYYYVPAGKEYDALKNHEDINPNTHYVIDWDNERIYEHPLGQLADDEYASPKIKKLIKTLKPKGEYTTYIL